MAVLTANFDLGTDGVIVATGDPGNATAWDAVTNLNFPTTFGVYSVTQFVNGTKSFRGLMSSSGTEAQYLSWTTALGTITDSYGRLYMFLPSFPGGTQMPFMQLGQGTTRGARLDILTTGKIRAYDNPAGAPVDTTASVATGQWIRIEWHVIHSATVGQIEVKLFNTASDVSPTETLTSPANLNTLANATEFDVGVNAGQAAGITNGTDQFVYFDAVVANATSYPGPFAADQAPQVLAMQTHVFGHGVW